MNKITIKCVAVLLTLSLLTGCMTNEAGQLNKTNVGTLGGAVAGGLIGSRFGRGQGQVAGVALGAMLGAFAGRAVGSMMDKQDLMYHKQTQQLALESNKAGVTSSWHNPDTGLSGTTTPLRTYQAETGRYCREYSQTVKIGDKIEEAYGKACRQPDGSWQIIQ
jgi:surface antigen